jgi:hypothetical protein
MPSGVRPRLYAVETRAGAEGLAEAAAEVEGAVEADLGGDLLDRAAGVTEEAGSLAEAELAQRVGDGLAGLLLEQVRQPGRGEKDGSGKGIEYVVSGQVGRERQPSDGEIVVDALSE